MLGVPQSRYGRLGEDKDLFPLQVIEPQTVQQLSRRYAVIWFHQLRLLCSILKW